jgi:hypothetical protein
MGRRNKKYYNRLKEAVKQKKLGIVSSGTIGLTLKDEIAPKDHFRPPSTPKRLQIQPQQEIHFKSPLKRRRLLKENQDKVILK